MNDYKYYKDIELISDGIIVFTKKGEDILFSVAINEVDKSYAFCKLTDEEDITTHMEHGPHEPIGVDEWNEAVRRCEVELSSSYKS